MVAHATPWTQHGANCLQVPLQRLAHLFGL
jgi:hypothetical protein